MKKWLGGFGGMELPIRFRSLFTVTETIANFGIAPVESQTQQHCKEDANKHLAGRKCLSKIGCERPREKRFVDLERCIDMLFACKGKQNALDFYHEQEANVDKHH